jgi:hypothetical protein
MKSSGENRLGFWLRSVPFVGRPFYPNDLASCFARTCRTDRPFKEILPEVDPELLGVNEAEPFFDFVRPAER